MTVPAAVVALAAGRPTRLVWENEVGGCTFEVGGACFVRWTPHDSGIDLSAEVARLGWAAAFTPVPRVLASGADGHGSWIVTASLTGGNAISHRWLADPARAVAAIGHGPRGLPGGQGTLPDHRVDGRPAVVPHPALPSGPCGPAHTGADMDRETMDSTASTRKVPDVRRAR